MTSAGRLAKKARGIAGRMRDRRPLMAAVSRDMLLETEQRFDRAEFVNGSKWPARKRPYPHPPLQKSKDLRRSLRATSTATTAGVETSISYARHQFNGTRRIPARSPLGINRRQSVRYLKATGRYVLTGKIQVR